jgi:hypothetical protein
LTKKKKKKSRSVFALGGGSATPPGPNPPNFYFILFYYFALVGPKGKINLAFFFFFFVHGVAGGWFDHPTPAKGVAPLAKMGVAGHPMVAKDPFFFFIF